MNQKTFDSAIRLALVAQSQGATAEQIAQDVCRELADAGDFGKVLDRNVRRVVRQVTGTQLEPGMGSGSVREDGSFRRMIYRRSAAPI